nr:GGDEF domain-containing protein [Kineococcus aurantiacus]
MSCWDVTRHVERARDLTHRATHDRLTGLPNRGLLEDRWEQARSRARRAGTVPLVAFCDLDDLKQLNDRHGHLAGDRALVAVADRLVGVSRAGDTVARFGGDEFVVLVDSAADVDPQALLERLREAVADVPVDVAEGVGVRVGCSVGLVVDDPSLPTAEVLARADRRMYEDKRRDRGRRPPG